MQYFKLLITLILIQLYKKGNIKACINKKYLSFVNIGGKCSKGCKKLINKALIYSIIKYYVVKCIIFMSLL